MASEVLAVRVSVSGELLDATPIVIAKLNAVSEPVDVEAVLSDGDSFFIAWHRGIQGRFVTFSGSAPVLSPVIQFESTGDMPRFFAFDGSKYVVAYVPLTGSPFDRRLYFKRFSSADVGTAVPVAYQASDCGNALGATGLYSLASNGKGESLVVYSGQTSAPGGGCRSSFRAIQIGSNSQPKFAPIPLPASATNLTASYLDGKYYVAGLQIDEVTNAASAATLEVKLPNACNATGCLMRQGSLVVSRITPQGVPLDPPTIAPVLAAPGERSPFVVSGAGEYLVVWREEGESASTIRAGRVSANGASLDPAPLTISGPMSLNMTGALNAVSFNGTDFLVLYADTGGLRVKRVSPLGVVKDPIGIVIAEYPTFGVLACGSDNCLVAWGAAAGVVATRLAADGSRLDSPPIQIVDDGWPTMLAARGSGYVLQFDNGIDGGTVLLDATGHKSGPVKARKAQREYPCGSNFLVFKQPPVTPGSPGSFVVSLVDVAGSVLVDNVNVGWRMSSEYGVASKATGCAVAALKQTDDSNDIYANFIQNDGSVGLPQAMPIATDAFTEVSPALAFDGDRLLVAYSHLIPTAPYGNFRIAARLVSQGEINPGTGGAAGGLAGTGGVVGTGGSVVGTGGSVVGTGGSVVGTGGSVVGTGGSVVGTGGSVVGTGGSVVGTGGSGDAAGSGDLAAGVAGISTSDGGAAGDAEEVGVGGIINTGGGGRSATGGSAVGGAPRDKGGKRGGGCAVTSRNPAGPADHYAFALLLVALAGWRRASRERLTERVK